jgi:hypothetical protein
MIVSDPRACIPLYRSVSLAATTLLVIAMVNEVGVHGNRVRCRRVTGTVMNAECAPFAYVPAPSSVPRFSGERRALGGRLHRSGPADGLARGAWTS